MKPAILTQPLAYQEETALSLEIFEVDVNHLITEDDTPLDNVFSERQMQLLTDTLYTSWQPNRPFIALMKVGLFYSLHEPALVPDVMISLDVQIPADVWEKKNRSYLIWEYGKPPEVVIEVVSKRKGREVSHKMAHYARLGIAYYILFDPAQQLSNIPLRLYSLRGIAYQESKKKSLNGLGLALRLWDGNYRGMTATWLRWVDQNNNLLLTGEEKANLAIERATTAEEKNQRLLAQIRFLGIEPEG